MAEVASRPSRGKFPQFPPNHPAIPQISPTHSPCVWRATLAVRPHATMIPSPASVDSVPHSAPHLPLANSAPCLKGHPTVTSDAVSAAPSKPSGASTPLAVTREGARERRCTITLDGRELVYTLRESPRARRLHLRIRPEGELEVVVPRRTARARIEEVLREKAGWINATLARLAREAAALPTPMPLVHGQTLPLAGRELRLALLLAAPAAPRPRTRLTRTRLIGETLAISVADGRQETVRAALEAWYRAQARAVFAERIAHCNAAYGFTFGRVSIKEQKSRWGSCSRAGNLNFNWRLLLAPLPVLDYVVYHELAHLKEMNHSPRFWRLVARACPEYETHRAWLRRHGRTLRL